jgi:hypothetical protein
MVTVSTATPEPALAQSSSSRPGAEAGWGFSLTRVHLTGARTFDLNRHVRSTLKPDLAPAKSPPAGAFHCVACSPQKRERMAILLAVGVTILLAIVISIAYVLILSELRKINANLEQFIKLIIDARRRDDPEAR